MEGNPILDISTESSHGREKVITPFVSTGVGKRTHQHRRCKVLLTDDPWSSAPQSPTGMGTGLGSGIRDRDSRLNRIPR